MATCATRPCLKWGGVWKQSCQYPAPVVNAGKLELRRATTFSHQLPSCHFCGQTVSQTRLCKGSVPDSLADEYGFHTVLST